MTQIRMPNRATILIRKPDGGLHQVNYRGEGLFLEFNDQGVELWSRGAEDRVLFVPFDALACISLGEEGPAE